MNPIPFIPLAQIPLPDLGAIETFLLSAAAVGSIVLLGKKLLPRKPAAADLITRTELHHELTAVQHKIDARFLALSEKIEANHKEILSALERQSTLINQLEAAVARLDERTKPKP
jgi:hypothetical protein